MLRCAMLVTLHGVGGGLGWGGHVDVPVTLHTGLDATLCYAGDVARGWGRVGVGVGMLTFL